MPPGKTATTATTSITGELHSLASIFGISDLYIDLSAVSGIVERDSSRSQTFHLREGRWRLLVIWHTGRPVLEQLALLPNSLILAVQSVSNPWENGIHIVYPIRGSIDTIHVGHGGGTYFLRTMGPSETWGYTEMIFPGMKISFWMTPT